jgi:hypothetical protein
MSHARLPFLTIVLIWMMLGCCVADVCFLLAQRLTVVDENVLQPEHNRAD